MNKIGFWWSSTFMSMTYPICYTYSPYSNGRFWVLVSPCHPPPTKSTPQPGGEKIGFSSMMITSQVMTRFNSTRFEFIFTSLVPRFKVEISGRPFGRKTCQEGSLKLKPMVTFCWAQVRKLWGCRVFLLTCLLYVTFFLFELNKLVDVVSNNHWWGETQSEIIHHCAGGNQWGVETFLQNLGVWCGGDEGKFMGLTWEHVSFWTHGTRVGAFRWLDILAGGGESWNLMEFKMAAWVRNIMSLDLSDASCERDDALSMRDFYLKTECLEECWRLDVQIAVQAVFKSYETTKLYRDAGQQHFASFEFLWDHRLTQSTFWSRSDDSWLVASWYINHSFC